MSTPKTSDDVMRELNDLAKRLGRYPSKTSREIEPSPGSILDVPSTPQTEERIRYLDEWIARREREAGAATEKQEDERVPVQDVAVPAPAGDPINAPSTATPAP
jgi:hypothetical protein